MMAHKVTSQSTNHNLKTEVATKAKSISFQHQIHVTVKFLVHVAYNFAHKIFGSQMQSIVRGGDHVINFQNHFHHLCCQQDLLLFAYQRLKYILLLHVIRPHIITIYATIWILLLQTPFKKGLRKPHTTLQAIIH